MKQLNIISIILMSFIVAGCQTTTIQKEENVLVTSTTPNKKSKESKKVIIDNKINNSNDYNFFNQEYQNTESSKFLSGWNTLPSPSTRKEIKNSVIDLTTDPIKNYIPQVPATEPVRIAREWEGYSVISGKADLTRMLSEGNGTKIDPIRIPWCAAFMNAVLKESGYEGTNSLAARSFLSYGIKIKNPEEGDIVVFKRGSSTDTGHVAFFVGYEYINNKQYIKALGGNQKKSVTMALYPANKLIGVRRI